MECCVMTGSGHLLFGTATAVMVYSLCHVENTPENVATALGLAAVSALAPDLDEPSSTLSQRLAWIPKGKTARLLTVMASVAFISWCFANLPTIIALLFTGIATSFTTMFLMKQDLARKVTLAVVGAVFAYVGMKHSWGFAMGIGFFVACAPWTKHRTVTHTIWATILWAFICWDFEKHLQVDGMSLVGIFAYVSHIVADSLTKSKVKPFWPIRLQFGIPFIRVGSKGGVVTERAIGIVMLVLSLVVYVAVYGIV